jgi:MoxR-like ATPase
MAKKIITNEELLNMTRDERFSLLSKREKIYFNLMKSTSGVLFITSKPGLAKSSMAKSIARVMGYSYLDVRLSIADETDFGMPKLKVLEINGVKY